MTYTETCTCGARLEFSFAESMGADLFDALVRDWRVAHAGCLHPDDGRRWDYEEIADELAALVWPGVADRVALANAVRALGLRKGSERDPAAEDVVRQIAAWDNHTHSDADNRTCPTCYAQAWLPRREAHDG